MSKMRGQEWKVGAFIVGAVALLIAALFWLGASRFSSDVVERVTYFDESVQGLEVGAPVKFRGVTLGKVTNILIAPDRRLVEVRSEIVVDVMQRMNLIESAAELNPATEDALPELRVIIASQGITGIKFLEADFFPPETPKVELAFTPPSTYVPSAPSTLKSLEDAVRGLGEELPLAIRGIRELAETLESQAASADVAGLTASVTGLSEDLRKALDKDAPGGIASETLALITETRSAVGSLESLLSETGGEGGSMARVTSGIEALQGDVSEALRRIETILVESDLPGTTATVRGAADSASRLAGDFQPTANVMPEVLRDLRSALRAVDSLVSLIERDPGVFLRGRSPSPSPRR